MAVAKQVFASPLRRRWFAAVAVSILVHVLIVMVVVRSPPGSKAFPDVGLVSIALSSANTLSRSTEPPKSAAKALANPSAADSKPPPAAPPPVETDAAEPMAPPLDLSETVVETAAVSAAVAAAAEASKGEPCKLTAWLQAALGADFDVTDALPHIPRPALSVANAVMLWDGGWVAVDPRAEGQISVLRAALVAGVDAAPAVCRDLPIRGPELLTLQGATGTTVIAVGSGEWRWADLLDQP